jgi:uncharacterized membrane protein
VHSPGSATRDSSTDRVFVRPVFAAVVFGFLTILLILVAAAVFLTQAGRPQATAIATSILAPCIPLLYFAGRGFRNKRRDAFAALPEKACALAAVSFIALGVLLGYLSKTWGLSAGPGIAAFAFAMCVTRFRKLVSVLELFLP